MENKEVIVITPSSAENDTRLSTEEEEDGSPLSSYFCLKDKMDMNRIEQVEDCFILDFDPCDPITNIVNDGDDDLSIVAEKGQVACRDYPHARHHCLRFPFDKTPHEEHCELCYCYVCDSIAPCESWTVHSDALSEEEDDDDRSLEYWEEFDDTES